MRIVPAEAETELPTLLEHVERGESVVITRRGKAVARLVPEVEDKAYDPSEAISAIKVLRKTMPRLTLEEILSARHEGHER